VVALLGVGVNALSTSQAGFAGTTGVGRRDSCMWIDFLLARHRSKWHRGFFWYSTVYWSFLWQL